jgi:osmotically-inducible protein OsmY
MIIWPLCALLVLALMSATGHTAEEGAGGERAKEPSPAVEPKKKQEADSKSESNGKQGADKPATAADEKTKDDKGKTEEKAKDDKAKAEEKAKDDKAKSEDKPKNEKAKTEDKPKDDKAKSEEKPKDEKAKTEDKAKEEKAKSEEKAKTEEAKPEEPGKKPVTSLNLAIKLALMADPQLFPLEIEVEMDKGKAVLTGSVPTEDEKAKVAEIAGKVEGVEGIVNKLTVTPALKDKLAKKQDESIAHVVRDRLSRSETLKAVGFDVKSENGIVYLSGKTRFQVIALEAAEAARQVPGVRAVDTAGVQLVAKD